MFVRETLKRALTSFLAIPTLMIVLFMLLAFGAYGLEQSDLRWLMPVREFMQEHVFGDPQATGTLLGTIAAGIITITSITFSLLLLALQQSASALTHQVFDQFLQRRLNQFYFGFFVGLALYALIMLSTVNPPYNPVLGATLALLLTGIALYVLLLLIYSTITQMRPTEIMRAIHDHIISGRESQLVMISKTRRPSSCQTPGGVPVRLQTSGFVVAIDVDAIGRAIAAAPSPVDVEFVMSIGTFVAFGDTVAMVRAADDADVEDVAGAVEAAVEIDRLRHLDSDPAYGIEQLETMAWRSISTSQQNPAPGITAIHTLRDILARWASETGNDHKDRNVLAISYPDDVVPHLLGAFESLAVAASESMQHQTYAAVLDTFALTFSRLPLAMQDDAEDAIRGTLAGMGDHVLTNQLDDALSGLIETLESEERYSTAAAVRSARNTLAESNGTLNSRSTRVPATG